MKKVEEDKKLGGVSEDNSSVVDERHGWSLYVIIHYQWKLGSQKSGQDSVHANYPLGPSNKFHLDGVENIKQAFYKELEI